MVCGILSQTLLGKDDRTVRNYQIMSKKITFQKNDKIVNLNFRAKN